MKDKERFFSILIIILILLINTSIIFFIESANSADSSAGLSGFDLSQGIINKERFYIIQVFGLFFHFGVLSIANWLIIPLLIFFLFHPKLKLSKIEYLSVISIIFIGIGFSFLGHGNYRYPGIVFPLILFAIFYLINKISEFYSFKNFTTNFGSFFVILAIINLYYSIFASKVTETSNQKWVKNTNENVELKRSDKIANPGVDSLLLSISNLTDEEMRDIISRYRKNNVDINKDEDKNIPFDYFKKRKEYLDIKKDDSLVYNVAQIILEIKRDNENKGKGKKILLDDHNSIVSAVEAFKKDIPLNDYFTESQYDNSTTGEKRTSTNYQNLSDLLSKHSNNIQQRLASNEKLSDLSNFNNNISTRSKANLASREVITNAAKNRQSNDNEPVYAIQTIKELSPAEQRKVKNEIAQVLNIPNDNQELINLKIDSVETILLSSSPEIRQEYLKILNQNILSRPQLAALGVRQNPELISKQNLRQFAEEVFAANKEDLAGFKPVATPKQNEIKNNQTAQSNEVTRTKTKDAGQVKSNEVKSSSRELSTSSDLVSGELSSRTVATSISSGRGNETVQSRSISELLAEREKQLAVSKKGNVLTNELTNNEILSSKSSTLSTQVRTSSQADGLKSPRLAVSNTGKSGTVTSSGRDLSKESETSLSGTIASANQRTRESVGKDGKTDAEARNIAKDAGQVKSNEVKSSSRELSTSSDLVSGELSSRTAATSISSGRGNETVQSRSISELLVEREKQLAVSKKENVVTRELTNDEILSAKSTTLSTQARTSSQADGLKSPRLAVSNTGKSGTVSSSGRDLSKESETSLSGTIATATQRTKESVGKDGKTDAEIRTVAKDAGQVKSNEVKSSSRELSTSNDLVSGELSSRTTATSTSSGRGNETVQSRSISELLAEREKELSSSKRDGTLSESRSGIPSNIKSKDVILSPSTTLRINSIERSSSQKAKDDSQVEVPKVPKLAIVNPSKELSSSKLDVRTTEATSSGTLTKSTKVESQTSAREKSTVGAKSSPQTLKESEVKTTQSVLESRTEVQPVSSTISGTDKSISRTTSSRKLSQTVSNKGITELLAEREKEIAETKRNSLKNRIKAQNDTRINLTKYTLIVSKKDSIKNDNNKNELIEKSHNITDTLSKVNKNQFTVSNLSKNKILLSNTNVSETDKQKKLTITQINDSSYNSEIINNDLEYNNTSIVLENITSLLTKRKNNKNKYDVSENIVFEKNSELYDSLIVKIEEVNLSNNEKSEYYKVVYINKKNNKNDPSNDSIVTFFGDSILTKNLLINDAKVEKLFNYDDFFSDLYIKFKNAVDSFLNFISIQSSNPAKDLYLDFKDIFNSSELIYIDHCPEVLYYAKPKNYLYGSGGYYHSPLGRSNSIINDFFGKEKVNKKQPKYVITKKNFVNYFYSDKYSDFINKNFLLIHDKAGFLIFQRFDA